MIDRRAHDGRQLGIQIRLDPLGAFSLFGVPLHELGNRFALLGRLLTDRIAAGPIPSPELAWAWRTMRDAGADEGDQVRAVDRAPAVLRGLNEPQST
jgi:hypothetical protein